MITQRHRLHFNDEGWPCIGSGVRDVEVRVGRKIVHVRERHGFYCPWKKFTRAAAFLNWPVLIPPKPTKESS